MRNEPNNQNKRQPGQGQQQQQPQERSDNKRHPGLQEQQDKPDNKRQPGQQAQQGKPDDHDRPGQQTQQDKSRKGFDSHSDSKRQEEPGKGKISTSEPGGSSSEGKRL